ncbi:MAG: rod shape-determining protein MreC [Ferruginibacter sp.]|nr:rod shape-determining protein MreC [Ferruginibacter sp.]
MNNFTGKINGQYNKVEYYFNLSRTNDSLVKANEILYNKLRNNFNIPDSANKLVVDSVRIDSLIRYRKFNYLSAKVVSNSVSLQSNFIVITGENVKLFKKGMGVVGVNNDVVGVITEVDGDYAVVMSLLHKDNSKISGKLFKGTETGTIIWNGVQPNILSLTNIPKSAKVAKGDSIITSGYSAFFPKGILIGRVIDVKPETANNNFKITFKSAADFYNLEYVYAIQSIDAEPINNILEKNKAATN